jgi:hypothetical protein
MSTRPIGIPTPRPIESDFEDFGVFIGDVCRLVFDVVVVAVVELGFETVLDELEFETVLDELGLM